MPGVTPDFSEESNVEVSYPTLSFIDNKSGLHLLTESLRDVLDTCEHHQRRFMYGNDRMYLTTNTMTTMFRKMMDIWYANPMDKQRGILRRKNKIV